MPEFRRSCRRTQAKEDAVAPHAEKARLLAFAGNGEIGKLIKHGTCDAGFEPLAHMNVRRRFTLRTIGYDGDGLGATVHSLVADVGGEGEPPLPRRAFDVQR